MERILADHGMQSFSFCTCSYKLGNDMCFHLFSICFLLLSGCGRSLGDHIASIILSPVGIVTCDLGYEYLYDQPACIGTCTSK